MKKFPVIVISLLLGVSSLWPQHTKLIVSVDRAIVYVEPSENSTKIDNIRRGTVLTLFKKGIESSEWIYVTYQSERWKGKVTGFIKADLVATEEEMLKEDQRRMEEAGMVEEAAPKPEERTEVEAEAETKPEEELPDLREAFAKKKPEEKETVEKTEPTPKVKEEVKEPEPVRTVVIAGVTESPQNRVFALPQTGEIAELQPYAIIKREFEPPPPLFKAEEKIEEEAQPELQAEVLAVLKEEPTPEEEKEFLEETPQAKEIVVHEAGTVEAEEFKRPEPPPPIVTVTDALTESPQGRDVTLPARAEMIEMMVYDFIELEPPVAAKAEEKAEPGEEEIAPTLVKTEEKPEAVDKPAETEEKLEEIPKEEEIPAEEKGKEEEVPPEEEEPQVVKPPAETVKPPGQVVMPTELAQPKLPREVGLLSFGFGYGPSWGGFGGAVQVNIKENISIHLGAGLYPTNAYYSEYDWATNEWLYSIGIKYYLPFGSEKLRTYVDLMYGGISVEAVQLVKEIWYYEYTYENIQKTLYGPSLVAGAELKLGFLGLNGYLGLSYNTTEWEYWDRDYFLNGGLGLSLYF